MIYLLRAYVAWKHFGKDSMGIIFKNLQNNLIFNVRPYKCQINSNKVVPGSLIVGLFISALLILFSY